MSLFDGTLSPSGKDYMLSPSDVTLSPLREALSLSGNTSVILSDHTFVESLRQDYRRGLV